MMKKHKKNSADQKLPLIILILTILIVAVGIGLFVNKKVQDNRLDTRRVEQLKKTDEDIQALGDLWESMFPGQVNRQQYCRHDGEKYTQGALRCITQVGVQTKYPSEDTLKANIQKASQALSSFTQFIPQKELPLNSTPGSATTHGLIPLITTNSLAQCSIDYSFVHFDSPAENRRGEFNLSAHCIAGPLQKPVYKLEDIR